MATLSEIEGAISGMRQLAQDRSLDTVLISCKGHETRFRLPVPRKGKNGKGAKVLYEGEWVAPTKFEEACGVRSKVWRRSFKLSQHKQPKRTCHLVTKARVYTGLPEDPNGWVRMDVWLSRQSQQEEVEGSVGPQKGKRSSSSAGGASSPSDEEASHSSSEGEGKSSSSGNKASNDSDEEDSHSLSAHPSADPEEQGQQNAGFGPSIFEPAEAYKPIDPHSAGLAKFGPAGVADKQPKPANSTPPKHSARNTAFLAPFCARPASVAKTGPAKAGEGATYTPQDQPEDGPRMQETSGPSGEEVKGANNGIGFQLLKKRGRPSKKSLREDGLRMQEAPGPSAGGKEGVKNGIVFPQQKKRGRPSKKIQSEDGPRMQEALDSSAGKKEGAKTGIGFQQQIKGGRPPKKSQPDNAPGLRVASGPSPRDKEGSDEGVTVQQEKKRGRPPKVASPAPKPGHGQQVQSAKNNKRQGSEDLDPEQKRTRIEQFVKQRVEQEERAAAAAAAAAAATAKAREQQADWQAKVERLKEAEQEQAAAQRSLNELRQRQKGELEQFKREQARQLEVPTQVLQEKDEDVRQASAAVDEASRAFESR